jgi:hypothetical protein
MGQGLVLKSQGERHPHLRLVPAQSEVGMRGVSAARQFSRSGALAACVPHGGKPRLLDQVREAIRVRHYSLRTEEAYVHWVRRFILFHDKRHPREIGEQEITRFLSAVGRAWPVRPIGSKKDSYVPV